jgi:hypothetical protein
MTDHQAPPPTPSDDAVEPENQGPSRPEPAPLSAPPERSVLDERAADDRDEAWGDGRSDGSRDDWYRRERPPHHGG